MPNNNTTRVETISVLPGATSPAFSLGVNRSPIMLTLVPAGTANVQISPDGVNWVDWVWGAVTANTAATLNEGASYVRLVSASGTADLVVSGEFET